MRADQERWEFIEGNKDTGAMSTVVRKADREFIIGYVVTEARNPAVRAEDIARGQLIAKAPEMLEALKFCRDRLETLDDADEATDLDMGCLGLVRSVLAGIEG